MQVIISVPGRFHAFYLANHLLSHGLLKTLITSYPKYEVEKYGIPRAYVRSVLLKEVLERFWRRVPAFVKTVYNPQNLIHETFDRLAARRVASGDLCVAWSGVGLETIRRAKSIGMRTVIDEGSAHVLYQQRILKEEYEALGLWPRLAHPKVVERELEEYNEADFIAVPSEFVKRTFLEHGVPASKLIHVPYGVSLGEFVPVPKQDSIFRILYVGNLSLRKGVHYLIRAFKNLKMPYSELLLIGSCDEEVKPLLNGCGDSVRFIGPVSQGCLYKYYSSVSVFVLPSVEDGFGMVLLQAMACGLPVICTTNTGGTDVIRHGLEGFVIPIRDVEALKETILYLYEHSEEREAMGCAARKRAVEEFTWDHYGDRIVAEYSRILNGGTTSSAAQEVSHGTV